MTGQTLAQFRILEKTAEGGMGVVYRALDTRLGRTVAIKVLHPETLGDPERTQRFIQEARTASADRCRLVACWRRIRPGQPPVPMGVPMS